MPDFAAFPGLRYDPTRCDPADVTAPPYDVLDEDDRTALCARHPGQRRVRRPAPGPRRRGRLRRSRCHLPAVAGRGRRRPGPGVAVRLPDVLDGRAGPHGLDDRGARRPDPVGTGRGRHPAPRAHHAEGQERPAGPAAGHPGQPLPHLGPVAGPRAERPAALRWAPRGRLRGRRRHPPPAVGRGRPRPGDGHLRRRVGRAGGPGRRAPPLRDVAGLPGRAARRPRRRRGGVGHPGVGRGAGRGRAAGGPHPPGRARRARRGRPGRRPRRALRGGAGRARRRRRLGDGGPGTGADRPQAARPASGPGATPSRGWPTWTAPGSTPPWPTSTGWRSPTSTGWATVVGRVDAGDVDAGVLVRPATVAQILDIAHGGERMPPKTTFFYPKPRTGMVFRALD